MFTVKDNHRAKKAEIALQFSVHNPEEFTTSSKGHGRIETRILQVMDVPDHLKKWPGVEQILKITRTRITKKKTTTEVAYGITSLSKSKADPEKIMEIWRNHWRIENQLHWVRDTVFNEDRCTIKKGNASEIMVALRNSVIAISCKLKKSVTDLRFECNRFHKRAIKLIKEN